MTALNISLCTPTLSTQSLSIDPLMELFHLFSSFPGDDMTDLQPGLVQPAKQRSVNWQ